VLPYVCFNAQPNPSQVAHIPNGLASTAECVRPAATATGQCLTAAYTGKAIGAKKGSRVLCETGIGTTKRHAHYPRLQIRGLSCFVSSSITGSSPKKPN